MLLRRCVLPATRPVPASQLRVRAGTQCRAQTTTPAVPRGSAAVVWCRLTTGRLTSVSVGAAAASAALCCAHPSYARTEETVASPSPLQAIAADAEQAVSDKRRAKSDSAGAPPP